MGTYTCIHCGQEFEAKHLSAFCPDCKIAKCIICGKEFNRTSDYPDKKCCSRKCSGEYRKQTGLGKQVAQKSMKTKMQRYGSLHVELSEPVTKICEFCGKEFLTTNTRTKYCPGPHYKPCPVCGKPSLVTDLATEFVPTCSEECRQEKIRRTNQEKYGADCVFQTEYQKEKAKQTNLERYGVEHYSQSQQFRDNLAEHIEEKFGPEGLRCQEIRDKKVATNLERYGVPYVTQSSEFKEKSEISMLERYGGTSTLNSPILAEHVRSTNLARYGVENPMQNLEVRSKSRDTFLQKYGSDGPLREQLAENKKKTSLERYGTENPAQSKLVQDKMKATTFERFGAENAFQSEEIKKKITQINLERYGVENPMQSTELRAKARETNLLKYGYPQYNGSDAHLLKVLEDPSKLENYKQLRDNVEEFIKSHYTEPPTLMQLAKDTGSNIATMSLRVIEQNCQHLVLYTHTSYFEEEVYEFLKQYISDSDIVQHNRNIIKPKEIDIYIPKLRLGIECNPTYTHNSSKSTHFDNEIVPYNYHQNKTLASEAAGVHLVHIFGYQWTLKKDIVKSMLVNLLWCTPTKYYARNLDIRDVSDADSRKFLDENHIQGYTTSKVRIGLYDSDELVCLMTFSRKRGTMGHSSLDSSDDWDLTRFCTKKYCRCIGGASKLFKYFIQQYHPKSIVSFSDRSNTTGSVYTQLGFEKDSVTAPGYVWVDSKTDGYYTRVRCQKQNLRKLFNDPTIDIENKTENEIMEEHGFVQVYNSGLIKWMWYQH